MGWHTPGERFGERGREEGEKERERETTIVPKFLTWHYMIHAHTYLAKFIAITTYII